MFARNSHHLAAAALLCLVSLLSTPAGAAVTVDGEISTPISSWPNFNVSIAYNSGASGTVTVAGGSSLSCYSCDIAVGTGSLGTITVDGQNSTWNVTSSVIVGFAGNGTLNVQNKAKVSSSSSSLGYDSGSSGTAIVTGVGSTWTNFNLFLGNFGASTGNLTVTNGGLVTTTNQATISCCSGSPSAATISGAGSRWTSLVLAVLPGSTLTVANGGTVTTGTLEASPNELEGNGVINTKGLISEMDLVFDATHSSSQALSFGTGGVLNLNLDGTGSLGTENGSIRIADGVKVTSAGGSIGMDPGSNGMAIVTGTGSTWTAGYLWVGSHGDGKLTVGEGGKVVASQLNVGFSNNSSPCINLYVGGDGMLVVGTTTTAGSIVNSGKVNLYADAFLAAKTYSPITELQGRTIIWSGTGSYNAYGGTWNADNTFTVGLATTSDSAAANTLTTGERLLITDSGTGKRVGASFGTVAGGTNFSAAVLSGADLSGLPADQSVLGAWNFTTNFSGDQALLSFDIGAGQTGALSVWRYDGTTWTPFAAPDLTYGDDGIADFAVTGFGGYAVTVAVPEPCSLALVALGGLALLRRRAA